MRRIISGCLCALVLLVIDASAQNGNVTSDTKVTSDNGKVVTMVGCVMIGGGTNFMLANITSETGKNDEVTAHTGGPYALVERDGLDLGPYIGQKVELKAVSVPAATKGDRDDKIRIEQPSKPGVANAGKKSNAATTVKVTRGAMPQFLVASVKMLAPHCDR